MESETAELTLELVPVGRNGTATVTARVGGEVLEVEKLDLSKGKQRTAFAKRICMACPVVEQENVEAELLRQAARMAAAKPEATVDKPKPDRLAAMPELVRREAIALLESHELLQRVMGDISRLGVAGEGELAVTVYLVGTSRLLRKPLAAIVQGPSSSGKSYVVKKVSSLFPPESVVAATQMTPQALFHMRPGSLKNRFVVAGERSRKENDDSAEATRALREMISSGELHKLMPTKVGGEIQTQRIFQEGPISYIEMTTLATIFEEDANRALLLSTDEQAKQTRRILDKLAVTYSGCVPEVEAAEIVERHHALQRTLTPWTVVVPFAERLASMLADDRVETRRAYPHLISTVQASALLHQRQRKIDAEGRLIASADDYQLARHLLLKPLGRLLGGRLSDPARRFLARLRDWYSLDDIFTKRDATRQETASKSSVYGWISELHDAGILEQAEAGRGRAAAKWQLSVEGAEAEESALLPTCEKLFPDLTWKQRAYVLRGFGRFWLRFQVSRRKVKAKKTC